MGKIDEAGDAVRKIAGYLPFMNKPPGGRNLPALLAARRSMIDASPGVLDDIPIVTARGGWEAGHGDALPYIDILTDQLSKKDVSGLFSPSRGRFPGVGIVAYPKGNRATRRHEVMHGYTEAARQGYPGMPAVSRIAAKLPHFLSTPLDEMAATRAGGSSLLTNPWPWYASYYAKNGDYGPAAVYAGLGTAQAGAVATAAIAAGAGSRAFTNRARQLLVPDGPEELGTPEESDEARYLAYEEMRRRHNPEPSEVMYQDELIQRLNQ